MTEEPQIVRPYHHYNIIEQNGTSRNYTILDSPIKEIWPHTILDNVSYLCVYLPTEMEETIRKDKLEFTKKEWRNHGFFVCCDYSLPNGINKRLVPVDDEILKKKYKINVATDHNQTRWMHLDVMEWQKTKEKINPKVLLELFHQTVPKYVELDSEETYFLLYLWIIGTYFYRLFAAYPYLDLTGTKRAGKTKTLEIINYTAFNSILSPDLTSSVVYRLIEQTGATIILDEAEHFKNPKSEQAQAVRTLLNQGFKRSMFAYRSDTKEKNFTPVPFNLYSPKAFGHINSFDDVLEDRCIQILMKRSSKKTIQNTHPWEYDDVWWKIRAMCYRLFLDYADMIETMKQKAEEVMPVTGRERELWLPILTLAQLFESFGVPVAEKIRQYATKSSEERQTTDESESIDVKVSKYIVDNLSEDTWYNNKGIHDDMMQKAQDYDLPKDMNIKGISTVFRRLGVKRKKSRDGLKWMVNKADLSRLRQTYLGEAVLEEFASPSSHQAQTTSDAEGDGKVTESSDLRHTIVTPSVTNELGVGDGGDGESVQIGNAVTEVTEGDRHTASPSSPLSPTSFNTNSSWISDVSQIEREGMYLCTSCDAGPFRGEDDSRSSGNLAAFHINLGHKVLKI